MTPNRSRLGRFLAVGLGLLVIALLLLTSFTGRRAGRRAGPSFEGKTLKQWTDAAMDSLNPSIQTQAIAAVRSIGTNALPTLIQWLEHRDDKFHRDFYQFLQSKRAMVSMWPRLMENSEMYCENRAVFGFYALGLEARPALPSLELLVRTEDSTSPLKPINAARAYVFVDPAAAERLALQFHWSSTTNHELIAAAGRFRSAWAFVQTMGAGSNKTGVTNRGSATPTANSDRSGEGQPP